jgi:hypothetical protein
VSDQQFAVVFKGKIADGADPAQVRANLAKLFKADAARIEAMFSGKTVVVKKGIDEDTAKQYKAVLAKAGAVAAVVNAAAKSPAVTAPAQAEAPAEPANADRSEPAPAPPAAAPAAPMPDEKPATPPQAIDATMAEPGVILVEPHHVEAPDIDTAHLDMAEVGVDLVERQTVAAPEFDLSAFTLDPPGVTLIEPKTIPPPDIDTSSLSLDEN